jgi:hypothetical protein
MKLIFFLVAFFLVSIRFYFSWSGKDRENRGISETNMEVTSDNFHEELKYSGRFELTPDETGFKSISPGGFFKYKRNEVSVKAESNLKGEIAYSIYDGKNSLPLDDRGRKLITEAIKEMVTWGFEADARMERVYLKGGVPALLTEVDSMKTDQIKTLYLNRLLTVDSLSPEYLPLITKKIGSLGSDRDKANFLNKISSAQLNNPQIAAAYFTVLTGMSSDMDLTLSLRHFIDQDSVTDENAYKLIDLTGHLSSDMDKKILFHEMIAKGLINGPGFESLLVLISNMASDLDKVNLYKTLSEGKNISDSQWKLLIDKSALVGLDPDKAGLLSEIGRKMPKTETLKAAYMLAAKSIGNDMDYGKAIRAIE